MTTKAPATQVPASTSPKKAAPAAPAAPPVPSVLQRWLGITTSTVGKHVLHVMTEVAGARATLLGDLRDLVRSHYVSPEVTAKRLAEIGAPKTAKLLREHLPTTATARSGDLGEVLATEIAVQTLKFTVPIRRLRWKDGRNMALRGDDIVGIRRRPGTLDFLKGEAKSRAALATAVLDEAGSALDSNRGRPTRHAVLFVAERLRELGDDAFAAQLEAAVLESFARRQVEHMLFALTGSDPTNLLGAHLTAAVNKTRKRHAVGFQITDHSAFIETLYAGL